MYAICSVVCMVCVYCCGETGSYQLLNIIIPTVVLIVDIQ